jgi:hypothetical protein
MVPPATAPPEDAVTTGDPGSLSSLANTSAPGYVAPAATPTAPATPVSGSTGDQAPPPTTGSLQEQQDAEITRQMNAAGLGYRVPALMESRAIARSNQIKAQEAQQDQDDQKITQSSYAAAKGDPAQWANNFQAAGGSMKGLMAIKNYNATLQTNLLKQKEAQDDLGAKDFAQDQRNLETLRDHLDRFAQRSQDSSDPDGQAQQWKNWLSSNSDLMSAEHMTATLQAHPGVPTPSELTMYRNMLTTSAMSNEDAKRTTLQLSVARGQKDDLITSLQGAQSAAAYDAVLNNSTVPHADLPVGREMFQADRTTPIASQFNMLNRMALTPEQRQAADNAAKTLAASENWRNANLALGAQRVQQNQEKIDNKPDTPSQHKILIGKLADQAMDLSRQGGGGSLPQALADVNNGQLYRDDSTQIGTYRGEVAKELQARINAPAEEQKKLQGGNKGAVTPAGQQIADSAAYVNAFGALPVDATGKVDTARVAAFGAQQRSGGRGATPATPTAQKQATVPPPPPATAVKIRVKLSDGRTGSVDAADFDPKTMTRLNQ